MTSRLCRRKFRANRAGGRVGISLECAHNIDSSGHAFRTASVVKYESKEKVLQEIQKGQGVQEMSVSMRVTNGVWNPDLPIRSW